MMKNKKVIIVGGGVSGMQLALRLKSSGIEPIIVERNEKLGGKVRNWHVLFPTFTPSTEVVTPLCEAVVAAGIEVRYGAEVLSCDATSVTLRGGERLECDAVAVCSGATLFDARLKEEYGYGIYDNVYTSADLERMFTENRVLTVAGEEPQRIAILHCVGSRDEKVCQRHCSKLCCMTGVKQAIELKRRYPKAEVFNFYMDMRMFGLGYEELYREAQMKYNVHFVRGRISEASALMDGRVQIKAEDTLTGRPLRMSVDMLVLMIGTRANDENATIAASSGVKLSESGFFATRDHFLHNTESACEGLFFAGMATAPKTISEALCEAVVAADRIVEYLNKK